MSPIVYPQTDLKLEGTETEAGALNFAHTIGRFAFNSPTKDGNLTRTKGEESDAKPSLNGLYGQEPAKAKVEAELPFEILLSGTTGQNLQRSLSPLSHVSPPPSPPTTGRKRKQRTGDTSGNEYTPVKVSGSPRKKQLTTPTRKPSPKKARGFADPEVYAHLKPLADRLGTHLNVIFCGINPGIESAIQGHHFAYKGNNFYKMIFFSGFTDRLVPAAEDETLPEQFNVGLINLIDRPTASESELSKNEMFENVPTLLKKLTIYQPRFICFIGKGMCGNVEKIFKRELNRRESLDPQSRDRLKKVKTEVGLRPFKLVHEKPDEDTKPEVKETLFFCSHSSSGLATSTTIFDPDYLQLQEKIDNLKVLSQLITSVKEDKLDTSTFWSLPT